jgi:hypothetical protein
MYIQTIYNTICVKCHLRGVKTIDGIYFYGKDIERMLKLVDIRGVLNNETSTYKVNIHYKNLFVIKNVIPRTIIIN